MQHLAQAQLMLRLKQFTGAENILRQALSKDPSDATAHALLALALVEQKKVPQALEEARQAVRLAPDADFNHFIASLVFNLAEQPDAAMRAILEAIRLNPQDGRYHGVLSQLYLEKRNWQAALKAAEAGLALDPQDVDCINLRSTALLMLGRKDEAGDAIEIALARDPENAATHASLGWTYLYKQDMQKAFEHFREALRLNPNSERARIGIVEAMKARNPIYKVMLNYFLWMLRLDNRTRVIVIIGIMVGGRALSAIAKSSPALMPIALPLFGLYLAFVLMTWTADSLFNLVLRLDKFGRLALSKEQLVTSNWIGLCLLVALVLLLIALPMPTDNRIAFLEASAKSAVMVLPISGIFRVTAPQNRLILTSYSVGLVLLAIVDLIQQLNGTTSGDWDIFFIIGIVAFTWIATALISRE